MIDSTKLIVRFHPEKNFGLTKNEVKSRIRDGLVNKDDSHSTKSTKKIIKDNLLTLFNLINLILAIAILCVGSYRNLMFMGVVICNSCIGIWQEIRTKKTIDRLNLIASEKAKVIREGKPQDIKIQKIVLDDIIIFERGNQIVTDCIIIEGNCEVNESLLTGEPDLITKRPGDKLLSGSYIVSGKCTAQVEHVGENNFAFQLLKTSKLVKKSKSEIMNTLNKIIKIISIAIIPIGAVLFYRQFTSSGYDYTSAIVSTAAALTGMIPEGLVLLTSSVLAVGIMRLSRHKVLAQDLYCLETLARADTICLDKTGTLTEGSFEIHEIIPQNNFSIEDAKRALKMLSSNLTDNNETFKAIQKSFAPDKNCAVADKIYPFSSEKKWSGAHFKNEGSYIIGAAEFIFGEKQHSGMKSIKKYSEDYRVLAIAHSDFDFDNGNIPQNTQEIAIVLLKDTIRMNAEKTLNFFKKQGVNLKIISGDDPRTVAQIAKRVSFENPNSYIDASSLKSYSDIEKAVSEYTIFGRVTPSQKQDIVKALKSKGHTVAMVGDGVNDVPAMKEADCSVAMASGSDIARNIAHLVLLNSNFSSMPHAVAEGRKAINNLQRSSCLFLTKTIYSFLLAILFFIIPAPYPFIPIQMTLISTLAIGIPSFILGLEPNRERIHGNLLANILSKSLPAAISIITTLMACVGIYTWCGISQERYYALTVALTALLSFILLGKISQPLNKTRKILLYSMIGTFAIAVIKFYSFFELERTNWVNILILLPMIIFAAILYEFMSQINWDNIVKNKFRIQKSKS